MGNIEDVRKVIQDFVAPDLKAFSVRMDALEKEMKSGFEHAEKLNQERFAHAEKMNLERFGQMEKGLAQMEKGLAQMERTITSVAENFAKISQGFERLDVRVSGVERSVEEGFASIVKLSATGQQTIMNTIAANQATIMNTLEMEKRLLKLENERFKVVETQPA